MAANAGRRWGLSAGLVLGLVMGLMSAGPASAAAPAPTGLSPAGGASTTSSPTLSWSRVQGAAKYEVQVATTTAFTTPLYSASTLNIRSAPNKALPFGTVYWRVRSLDSANVASVWSTNSFTVSSTAAPSPVTPADGTALPQPQSPPLLSWTGVPGATSYTVEVDTDSDFLGASTYSTKSTSLLVPDPKASGTYYWKVRATLSNGLSTASSVVRTYTIGPLAQVVTTYPVDNENTAVEDVVLQWNPVPAAKTYDLLVSTDQAFNTIIDTKTGIKSTRYSPLITYNNDQYYWKVRARNNLGETIDWAEAGIHNFRRTWLKSPTRLYPADALSPAVGGDFFLQWSPVQHATRYSLDVGTDANFSPTTYKTCLTASTTYTVGLNSGDACMPGHGVPTYWRVKALDDPAGVESLFSATAKFIYNSGVVQKLSPASGSTVSVPLLTWSAARAGEKYKVTLTDSAGKTTTATTYALSWSPTGEQALDPAKSPYSWTVQSIGANGSASPIPSPWTFSVSGTPPTSGTAPLTPLVVNGGAPSLRFPNLRWEPMAGAGYYTIRIGLAGTGFWLPTTTSDILTDSFPYPSATDTGAGMLNPGDYVWDVQAFSAAGASLGYSPVLGEFSIADIGIVTGQKIALTGVGLDSGKACTAYLDATGGQPTKCIDVPSTPVLDWDPVPQAASYMIYVGADRELTNMVYTGIRTTNTRWTPRSLDNPAALPDSQAGQAYYWFIRPCKASGYCAPDPMNKADSATNAFNKKSPAVVRTAPAENAVVTTSQVRFDWTDYLTTNAATVAPSVPEPSIQAARRYHLQVSQSASFSPLVDDRYVDQATYTAYDKTYPEGPVYWRVQAEDAEGNLLTWSPTFALTKTTPSPILTSPNDAGSGSRPFVWKPTNYAGSYQLEVYKNDDANHSSVNRIINVASKQTAYTPATAVPTSDAAYRWRVARIDADGKLGQWSADMRFTSTGDISTLLQPDAGAYVNGYSSFFAWSQVAGATTYKFERKLVTSSSAAETVTTPGLAWAPTASLATGAWQWRVTALDANNVQISTTAWRNFTVDNTRGMFTAVSPTRQLDTRIGLGAAKRQVGPGQTITLAVKGLPASATAVVLNVTVTRPTLGGVLTVYPAGQSLPTASNLNFVKGQTVPNLVTVAVGPGGKVNIRNGYGYVDVVADLAGFFTPEGIAGFTPVVPTRVLDTRIGTGVAKAKIPAFKSITLTVPGLPADTTAVAMNVTAANPTAAGFATVYPAGQAMPNASNLNFVAGQAVPNMVVVAVGPGGKVSLANNSPGTLDLVADLSGYFRPAVGAVFKGQAPTRVLDTRIGIGAPKAKLGQAKTLTLTIPNLPAGTTAVALNVTVTGATVGGVVTVYPTGQPKPLASNLNFVKGQTVPNMVMVPVGPGGQINLFNGYGEVDLVADLAGAYIG
jgi:hypothetical protein